MTTSLRALAAALFAALATTAHADLVASSHGVDFSLHVVDTNTFTLDITGAPDATGVWASATALGYLAFDGLGSLSGLSGAKVTVGAGSATSWTYTLAGMNASGGCKTSGNTGVLCLDAPTDVALTNHLMLTIDLLGSGINLGNLNSPTLKVGFTDNGSVIGGVGAIALSEATTSSPLGNAAPTNDPANSVPEPATLALAGLALAGVAASRRRRS